MWLRTYPVPHQTLTNFSASGRDIFNSISSWQTTTRKNVPSPPPAFLFIRNRLDLWIIALYCGSQCVAIIMYLDIHGVPRVASGSHFKLILCPFDETL